MSGNQGLSSQAALQPETNVATAKWSGLKVLSVGSVITIVFTLLVTFLVDVNLPKVTWFMEIFGRTALVVFGVLYAFWLEEADEWWVL
jgi:hypothetical protein